MYKLTLISYVALTLGCAGPRVVQPTVPESVINRVETRELPEDPATMEVPANLERGDWVVPVNKGECLDEEGTPETEAPNPCPFFNGIAVAEERAYRDGLYRIGYKELRTLYELDRQVWAAHRELYEERLKLADRAIQDLQPSWFDRNKLQLGVIGGVLVGVATTVAVLAVTNQVE